MKWFLLLSIFLVSCSLFGPKFTRTSFSYTGNAGMQSIPVIIPKGYRSSRTGSDSSGGSGVLYDYGKSVFYVAYVRDSLLQTEFVDTTINIPLSHPLGGLIYKGISKEGLFWREIRRGNLRVGYRDVPHDQEGAFDSASNYVSRTLK